MSDRESVNQLREELEQVTQNLQEILRGQRLGCDANTTESLKALWLEVKFLRKTIFEGNGQNSLILQLEHRRQDVERLTSAVKEINDHLEERARQRQVAKSQERQNKWTVILAVVTAFLSLLSSLCLLLAEFLLKRGGL